MKNLLESKVIHYVTAITFAVVLTTSVTYGIQGQKIEDAVAQDQTGGSAQLQSANITGDLTKPAGGNPYGGEKTGDITILSDGHQTDIKGLVNASPAPGKVYEAWLQDAGGSEYKLSLGQLKGNGTIDVSQYMVNPFTYTVFFVTEEPENDVDPNAADPVAGVKLEAPFGQ
jgi:hypothetical protein